MVVLCRRCGRRPAVTSDGFCFNCKGKDRLKEKLGNFNRRQKGLNTIMSGNIV